MKLARPSNPGTFDVTVKVDAAGYATETNRTTLQVVEKPDNPNDTGSQNNSTDKENNNSTLANDVRDENKEDLDCADIDETKIPIGNNDPDNLEADGDSIGCEENNNNGDENDNTQSEEQLTSDQNPQGDEVRQ